MKFVKAPNKDLINKAMMYISQIVNNNVYNWANKKPATTYGKQLIMRMTNNQIRNFGALARKYMGGSSINLIMPVKGFISMTKWNKNQEILIEKIPNNGESKTD